MKKFLLPLAFGFEEVEFVSVADLLRRAGVEVVLASLDERLEVVGSHQITIKADTSLSSIKIQDFDGIALHGGLEGMKNMLQSQMLHKFLQELHSQNKIIGAICAAPVVLDHLNLLTSDFCCYPGCEAMMKNTQNKRLNQAVNQDKNIITASGPAFAMTFAIQIIEALLGKERMEEIAREVLL